MTHDNVQWAFLSYVQHQPVYIKNINFPLYKSYQITKNILHEFDNNSNNNNKALWPFLPTLQCFKQACIMVRGRVLNFWNSLRHLFPLFPLTPTDPFVPVAHLGKDLKVDLADVEFRVWVQTLQCDTVSLQNRLGRPFNEQSGCMWTEITDAGYWSQHE